jgi:formylglycine-generating enzyme required for sulfatase activity
MALVATGMDPFEAIIHAAQGDRLVAARFWIEALRLVPIPSGKFKMGSPQRDRDRSDSEAPQHLVAIASSFELGAIQTTQGAWEALMGSHPSHFRGDPALPVEQVSWDDLCGPDGFFARLNDLTDGVRATGMMFRLPTEAEWEYACRAETTMTWSFGDDPALIVDHAWTLEDSLGKPHPVGQKQPNSWGLYDMHGNAWEWCQDVWHNNYKGAPMDGSAWTNGGEASCRVIRGGSWDDAAVGVRSASRDRNATSDRFNWLGLTTARMRFSDLP